MSSIFVPVPRVCWGVDTEWWCVMNGIIGCPL